MTGRERTPIIFLLCMLVIGAAIRLHPLIMTNFVIDADEAIVGIMGKHILEGRPVPVFYYGQHYMGSLEAILASVLFGFFGISAWVLKLVPLIFSLALILVVYQLVLEISNQQIAKISAILLAIPPAALVEWSTKARGGFIEVVFLGALAFLFTARFLAANYFSWRTLLSASLVLGIGWWVNNQIVYFMIPIGLLVLGKLIYSKNIPIKIRIAAPFFALMVFFLGGLPYWIYNIQNDFVSFNMFSGASEKDIAKHISGLFSQALPIIWGAERFWHDEEVFPGSCLISYVLYGACLIIFVIKRARQLIRIPVLRFDIKAPWEMLLIFVVAGLGVFASSSFGYLVQAPRYLLPLYVGIIPITAFAIYYSSRILGIVLLSGILGLNILSSYYDEIAIPGEPIVYNGERVSRDHTEILEWLKRAGMSHVRTNYWIGYRLAFESLESITCNIFQLPHQVRIPEYEKRETIGSFLSYPIITVTSQSHMIRHAFKILKIQAKETVKSGYVVFYDIVLPYLGALRQIKATDFKLESSLSPQMLPNVLDGDLKTRWASARPQSPGMEVHVKFNDPTPLRFFILDYGEYQTDFGRKLVIEIADDKGGRRPLYADNEMYAVRYFIDSVVDVELFMLPNNYTDLWIKQTGSDPVFDWSIAELKLFSDSGI